MFKGLGNLANLGSLLKQAQQMGSKLQDINQRLKSQRATGTAGGGLVTVEVDGTGEVVSCRIDATLLAPSSGGGSSSGGDREFIEDLLPPAINQALAKAKSLQAEAMQSVAQGLDLSSLANVLNLEPQDPSPPQPGPGGEAGPHAG